LHAAWLHSSALMWASGYAALVLEQWRKLSMAGAWQTRALRGLTAIGHACSLVRKERWLLCRWQSRSANHGVLRLSRYANPGSVTLPLTQDLCLCQQHSDSSRHRVTRHATSLYSCLLMEWRKCGRISGLHVNDFRLQTGTDTRPLHTPYTTGRGYSTCQWPTQCQ